MTITLKNPTESDVRIVFQGEEYSIEAGKTADLDEAIASHWIGIHGFLQVEGHSDTTVEEKVEDKEDDVSEEEEATKTVAKKTTRKKKEDK